MDFRIESKGEGLTKDLLFARFGGIGVCHVGGLGNGFCEGPRVRVSVRFRIWGSRVSKGKLMGLFMLQHAR